MTKIEDIRAWKNKWGYDDTAVRYSGDGTLDGPFLADLKSLRDDLKKKSPREFEMLDKKIKALERPDAYDPRSGPVAKSAAKRVEDRGAVDLTAAKDQIGDLSGVSAAESEAKPFLSAVNSARQKLAQHRRHPDSRTRDPVKLRDWTDKKFELERALKAAQAKVLEAKYARLSPATYAGQRRAELSALTGGHVLGEMYGLRTINDMQDLTNRSGMRVDNLMSSTYQRDSVDAHFENSMKGLYEKTRKTDAKLSLPAFDPNKVFFVSNDKVAGRLDRVYGAQWVSPNLPTRYDRKSNKHVALRPAHQLKGFYDRTVQIAPNLCAILMTKGSISAEQGHEFKIHMLEGSGATPSAYRIMADEAEPAKNFDLLRDASVLDPDMPVKNDTRLAGLSAGGAPRALSDLPADHPMKQAASAAAQIVGGLEKKLSVLKATPEFQNNKVLANALDRITDLMTLMPSYSEDGPRFSRMFDLMVDEVFLVLNICKPYSKDDIHKTANKMMSDRAPVLGEMAKDDVKHETCVLGSGMGTMSAAVSTAFARTGSSKVTLMDDSGRSSANYFEVDMNLLGEGAKADPSKLGKTPPVIMGTLNPSTPVVEKGKPQTGGWGVDALIGQISTALTAYDKIITDKKPAVAIIDVTVEKEVEKAADQEINKLLLAFKDWITAGKLEVMLAKSYQKYPSLGSGKTMSGGLTVIGKGLDPAKEPLKSVSEAETAEGVIDAPETQIVGHFMESASDIERKMLHRAADNADFVSRFGLDVHAQGKSQGKQRHDAGLPFLTIDQTPIQFEGSRKGMKPEWLMFGEGAEKKMSFGFQNSSALGIGGGAARIGCGQESHAELVEKLYVPMKLAATDRGSRSSPNSISRTDVLALGAEAATDATVKAAALLRKDEGSDKWRDGLVNALLGAGVLKPSAITRDKASGKITKPTDTELKKMLSDIENDKAATPASLRKKLGLVGALKKTVIEDGAYQLSTTRLPQDPAKLIAGADKPDAKWREDAVKALLSEGRITAAEVTRDTSKPPLVTAPSDDVIKQKLAAMAKERNDWRDKAITELKARLPTEDLKDIDTKSNDDLRGMMHGLDDVTRMHARVKTEWDGDETGSMGEMAMHLPNVLVSCASVLDQAFDTADSRADVIGLADALLDTGLQGVSNEAAERLCDRRIRAGLRDLPPGPAFDAWVDGIARAADAMPYDEGPAKILGSKELHDLLKKKPTLSDPQLETLVAALMKPLNLYEGTVVLRELLKSKEASFKQVAKAAAKALAAQLKTAEVRIKDDPVKRGVDGGRGVGAPLARRDMSQPTKAKSGAVAMTQDDLKAIRLIADPLIKSA